MFRIVLIRPGATLFDEQGRIKGCMDMPLSPAGTAQAAQTASELTGFEFDMVYSAPCQSAQQTASVIARRCGCRHKVVDVLKNLNHGLWQGKLIDEVRRQQPKVYRQFQENPDSVCPPGGETLEDVRRRLKKQFDRWNRKHEVGLLALVVPEPLATVIKDMLGSDEIGDLWQSECDRGQWEVVDTNASLHDDAGNQPTPVGA